MAARRPIQPCSGGGFIWSSSVASAPPSARASRAATGTSRSQLSSPRGAGGTAAFSLRSAALHPGPRPWTAERERVREADSFWNRSAEVIASTEGSAAASPPVVRRRGSEAAAAAAAAEGRARRPASSPRASARSGVSAAVVDMAQCLGTEFADESAPPLHPSPRHAPLPTRALTSAEGARLPTPRHETTERLRPGYGPASARALREDVGHALGGDMLSARTAVLEAPAPRKPPPAATILSKKQAPRAAEPVADAGQVEVNVGQEVAVDKEVEAPCPPAEDAALPVGDRAEGEGDEGGGGG